MPIIPKVVLRCAWCPKPDKKPFGEIEIVSHGICPECLAREMKKIREMGEKDGGILEADIKHSDSNI